jgi:integrase/recombinase XerD
MDAEWSLLVASWQLAMEADGNSVNTCLTYGKGVETLADWLAEAHPGVGPVGLERAHVRGWLVHVRQTRSASTAKAWFSGVRAFYRWMVAEDEATEDPTVGIRTPRPAEPHTPVLSTPELKRLLKTTEGPRSPARQAQDRPATQGQARRRG